MAEPETPKEAREGWSARVGRWLRRVVIGLGLVFFVGVIGLLYALRTGRAAEWVRREVLTSLHDACQVNATFETFRFEAFPPEVTMTGLKMDHVDGRPLVSIDEAIVTLRVLPLFARRIQLDRVAVLAPAATLELEDGRVLNLPTCGASKAPGARGVPVTFGIRELTIERGRFNLIIDRKYGARLDDIDIALAPRTLSSGSSVVIGVPQGTLVLGEREIALQRLRVLGHLEGLLSEPRAIVLESFGAQVGRVELEGTGSVDLFGPVYETQLVVSAPLDAAQEFIADFPPASGRGRVEVSLSGTAAEPRAVGRAVLENGRIGDYGLADRTTVEFAADRRGAALSSILVELGEGSVKAKGQLAFDAHLSLQLELLLESLSLGRTLDAAGLRGAWVDFLGRGKVSASGTLLDPLRIHVDFDLDLRDFYVFDIPFDSPELRPSIAASHVILKPGPIRALGQGEVDAKGFTFTEAVLSSGATWGTAWARLNAAEMEGFEILANLSSFDFADVGPIAGIAFGGKGSVTARIAGPHSALAAEGQLDLDQASASGIPFGRVKSQVRWRDSAWLDFEEMTGKLGETTYTGELTVHLEDEVPFDIRGEISSGRVQDLLIPFGVDGREWGDPSGTITRGVFNLNGPIQRLSGPIDLSVETAAWVEERFERGRAVGRFEQGAIVVEELELEKHGGTLVGRGRLDPHTGAVRANLETKELTLQALDALRLSQPKLDGKLRLRLNVGGSLQHLTGSVDARVRDVTAGPLPVPPGELSGRLEGRTLAFGGALLGEALQVSGAIELASKLPYRAEVTLAETDIPKILGALRGATGWTGKTALKAKLSGGLVDWRQSSGEIALETAVFESGGLRFETASPAALTLDRGVLATKRLQLAGPHMRLSAEGRLGATIIDLDLKGRIDLAILEALTPSIERAGGELLIDSSIEGAPNDLTLLGTGKVSGGLLQWRGLDERLTALTADLTFSQSSVLIDRAQARWAGGRVEANGNLHIEESRIRDISLGLTVEDVRPKLSYPLVDLSAVLHGGLSVEGRPERFTVKGDLDVARGRLRPKLEFTSIASERRRIATNVYDPSAEIMELDINFHGTEPVRVKNDSVDIELRGDVRLTGTNQRLGFLGSINVVRGGRVDVLGREYEFEGGVIELQDRYRFFPRYDLVLHADACGARINLNLVGTLDEEPTTSYASNPEMDETNIVSCLFRGVRSENLDSDLAKFASGALWKFSGIDREVRKVLPVDEIDVTTEYSSQTRAYEPRVLVAKDLTILGGVARLEYSSSLSKNEDQEVRLRYRITPRLTLQGAWVSTEDVQPVVGDLGLDLKYRWEW